MELAEKGVAVVFALLILAQAYVVRRIVGTWLFPACLFGLFWFGYTFIPLALLPAVPVSAAAIAFVAMNVVAFSASALVFDWRQALQLRMQSRCSVPHTGFLYGVFVISAVVAVAFLLVNSLAQGITVYDLAFDFFASSEAYAELRYSEGITTTVFGQLSTVLAYVAVSLGGMLFESNRAAPARVAILLCAFAPSIFVTVAQSARGLLFLCIVLFYGGMLARRVLEARFRLFERGDGKLVFGGLAVVVPLVTVSFLAKGLYAVEDPDVVAASLWRYFASYSSAHIYAFSDWFQFAVGVEASIPYSTEAPGYGFYTFMALFKALGSDRVVPIGTFDDYFSHGDLLLTNIYTMYRGLVVDFGFLGSIGFMVLFGTLVHLMFYIMLVNRRPAFTVAAFVFVVGFFYSSGLVSLLTWNSVYVSALVLWLVLEVDRRIVRSVAP